RSIAASSGESIGSATPSRSSRRGRRTRSNAMLDQPDKRGGSAGKHKATAIDFQQHLAALEAAGLVTRIDRTIDKDPELHPLVRWQFVGGMPEDKRRAFLFTNVIDGSGKKYDMPVVVGALSANPQIYAI